MKMAQTQQDDQPLLTENLQALNPQTPHHYPGMSDTQQ